MRLLLIPLLFLLATADLAASQVELTLDDGKTVRGDLVSDDAFKVVIEQTVSRTKKGSALKAITTYDRAHVAKMVDLPSIDLEYDSRNATVGDTVPAQLELARWCLGNDLPVFAGDHAKRAVEIDAQNADAILLLNQLNYHQLDGKWLSDNDWLAATKQVRVGDQVMSEDAAAKLRADQETAQAGEDAQGGIAAIDRRLAANQTAMADIDKKKQALQTEMQQALRQGQQQQQQAQGKRANKNGANAVPQNADQQAVAAAYQQRLAQLDQDKAKLSKERQRLEASKTEAQKTVDAAKAVAAAKAADEAKTADDAKKADTAKTGDPAK